MEKAERLRLLAEYSQARISAIELRRALGGISYGDVLRELARHNLPLPRASAAGREQQLLRARELLFPQAA